MNNKKGFSTVAIILIVAATLIATGIAYYFLVYKSKPVTRELTPPPQTTEGVSLTPDMTDWKTYINEPFGFELKHPKDWSIEESQYGITFKNNSQVNLGEIKVMQMPCRCTNPELAETEMLTNPEEKNISVNSIIITELSSTQKSQITGQTVTLKIYIARGNGFTYIIKNSEIVPTFKLITPSADFIENGPIVSTNSQWYLKYGDAGTPAAKVKLIFDSNSLCRNAGSSNTPYTSCKNFKWSNNDEVSIIGKTVSNGITVKRMFVFGTAQKAGFVK